MKRLAGCACWVLLAATLGRRQALAQESPPLPRAAPPLVTVFVAGSPEIVLRTRATLLELGSRLDLILRVGSASDPEEASIGAESETPLVRAYIDLRSPLSPRVVVAEGNTRRTLVERDLPGSSSLELSVEAASHVVLMAVESALETPENRDDDRHRVSAGRPSREPPRAKPAGLRQTRGAARERPGWEAQGALFGSAVAFGSRVLPGAGAAVEANVGGARLRLGGLLSVAAYLPANLQAHGAEGVLRAGSLRLAPTFEWRASPAVAAFCGVGTGADRIRLDGARAPPGALAVQAEWSLDPVVTGLLGAKLSISRDTRVLAGLGLDMDLSPHRYVIESVAERQALFELARFRPTAFIGFSATILREADPESRPTVGRAW